MEMRLITKLKLGLIAVVVADMIALILQYNVIYYVILTCGWATYDVIHFG